MGQLRRGTVVVKCQKWPLSSKSPCDCQQNNLLAVSDERVRKLE